MFDEYLQREKMIKDTNFNGTLAETQTLLLGAFLSEKKKWEEQVARLWVKLDLKTKELEETRNTFLKQSKLKTFLFGLFKVKSSEDKALIKATQEVESTKLVLEKLVASEPNIDRYELAMFGNNLLKPR